MIYNLKYTTCFGHYLESPNQDKILSGKFVDINEYNKIKLENEKLKTELSYYTGPVSKQRNKVHMNELTKLKELMVKRLHSQHAIKKKMGLSLHYIAIENFNRGLQAAIDYIETGKFKGERPHE